MEKRGVSQHLSDELRKEAEVKRTNTMDELTERMKKRLNKNAKQKERNFYGK